MEEIMKIKSVTIINQTGTRAYCIGSTYNGQKLEEIKDGSIEFENSFHNIYVGYSKDGLKIFETCNAPTDVEFLPDEESQG